MIKFYSHWVADRLTWNSCHEEICWWPTKLGDPHSTNSVVRDILSWPESSRYFKVNDINTIGRGTNQQYLIVHTNAQSMSDCQGLACVTVDLSKRIQQGIMDLTIFFVNDATSTHDLASLQTILEKRLLTIGISRPGSVKILMSTKYQIHSQGSGVIKWLYYPWFNGVVQQNFIKTMQGVFPTIQPTWQKPFRYLCLGGRNYDHRMWLIKHLEYLGVNHMGWISMNQKNAWAGQADGAMQYDQDFGRWMQQHSVMEVENYKDCNDSATGRKLNLIRCQGIYDQAQWDIVQEIYHDIPGGTFLSEKVYRSIVMGVPFMINGPRHSLDALRDQGFQTFDGIIDESYDRISDPVHRQAALSKEIKQICSWDKEHQQQIWPKICSILQHNQQVFKTARHLSNIHDLLSS